MVGFFAYSADVFAPFKPDSGFLTPDQHEGTRKNYTDAYDFVLENAWTAESHPQVAQWREGNKDHITALLKAAHSRNQFFNPYVLSPEDRELANGEFMPELISILLPGVQQMREVARTLTIDANHHLGNGNIDRAIHGSIAIHRIGRLTARGGTLVEGLVGIAISSIASDLDRRILAAEGITAEQLSKHLNGLRSLPPMPKMIDKINLTERYMFLDTTIAVAQYGPSALDITTGSAAKPNPLMKTLSKLFTSSFVNWDTVLRRGNYWYDELYRVGTIKNVHERTKAYAEVDARIRAVAEEARDPTSLAKKLLLSGKSIPEISSEQMSHVMISLLLPALGAAISAEDRALMQNEVTQVAIALELHHLNNSNYPSNLQALVGNHLKTLPQDRFNEKGLTYKTTPRGYVLYSFGRNRQDDQGNSYEDEPRGDDISIKRER